MALEDWERIYRLKADKSQVLPRRSGDDDGGDGGSSSGSSSSGSPPPSPLWTYCSIGLPSCPKDHDLTKGP